MLLYLPVWIWTRRVHNWQRCVHDRKRPPPPAAAALSKVLGGNEQEADDEAREDEDGHNVHGDVREAEEERLDLTAVSLLSGAVCVCVCVPLCVGPGRGELKIGHSAPDKPVFRRGSWLAGWEELCVHRPCVCVCVCVLCSSALSRAHIYI